MAYVNKVHTVGFMRYTYSMILVVMLHAFMTVQCKLIILYSKETLTW